MSFASLSQGSIEPLIERFAEASEITLIVGAGASMEADLPSWPDLIERLLTRVAEENRQLTSDEARRDWVAQTIAREDLLGAAAVVEAMEVSPLDELIPEELYGEGGPGAFGPGPIAEQVAHLRACYGSSLEILTTNYDDLLEQALIDAGTPAGRIRSYCLDRRPKTRAANTVAVTHLHGLAGREETKKIVLTEQHYHRMQLGRSWQEELVTRRLEHSLCLFVGASLADPNLIRYLYGYPPSADRPHAAIFVRQGEPESSLEVRAVVEHATARRWAKCGVEAVFVDHFADAAQLLYEIGHRRSEGGSYRPVSERAQEFIKGTEDLVLYSKRSQSKFAQRQILLSEWLRALLEALVPDALGGARVARGERLALALWLFDRQGTCITGWAHSDRAHQDPKTVAATPVEFDSNWVAVRAVCQGVKVDRDRSNYASRWRFVRGLPLVTEAPSRLPIGCLTIASTKPGSESVLTRIPAENAAAFHDALIKANLIFLQQIDWAGI